MILPNITRKQGFIMGDFNIYSLNYASHPPTNDFKNNFLFTNFQPCIHHRTRVSDNSSSVIADIFINLTANILCGNTNLRSISSVSNLEEYQNLLIFNMVILLFVKQTSSMIFLLLIFGI